MTRSTLTFTTIILFAFAAPASSLAQDPATPPPTTPATPGDPAAPPVAPAGDPAEQDPTPTPPTPAPTPPATPEPAGDEAGQGLESDVAAADADEAAESTPIAGVATDDAAEPEEEPLPFRGSIFFWDHSYNLYGLTLPYSNPTYSWWFSFRPRWYFGTDYFVAGRFDAYYELTDSDTTTSNHQLDLGDAIFSFSRPKIIEADHMFWGATASLTLPLSIASRANGMVAGTGISTRVTREFENVLEGLSVDAALGYTHYWNTRNTVSRDEESPGTVGAAGAQARPLVCDTAQVSANGGTVEGACSGGSSNVEHSITFGLTGSLTLIEKLTLDLSYTWWWRRARGLEDATIAVMGRPVTFEDMSETHWRNLQVFSIGVGYDIVPWLNASVSWGTLTTQLNPSGTFRNPFANPDSSLSLTATVALDELYKVFRPTPQTVERTNPSATASNRRTRARQ